MIAVSRLSIKQYNIQAGIMIEKAGNETVMQKTGNIKPMAASLNFTASIARLTQSNPAPPPPWERLPPYQRLRIAGRAALMATGLAWTERKGLIARAMPELLFLRYLIPSGSLALDVGANIGVVASEIARYASHTLAFEPNPMPFYVLRHLRAKGLVPVWAAVGTEDGEAELVVPCDRKGPSNNGGHLRDSRNYSDVLSYKVPSITIDSIRLNELGFLKIDVEGHESEVLDGASETIRHCLPTIMVEHEVAHAGNSFGDVFDRLAALDYEGCFLEHGRLRHLSTFDAARHQGLETRKSDGTYVSNFFFLPRNRKLINPL
jgi:FkbM family methyltransferase